MASNPFCHHELHADDVGASKKFYKGLFDWKLADMPMGPGMVYTTIDVGTANAGGGMMKKSPGTPTQWLSYVLVDDVEKSLSKAKKLGAKEVVPTTDIPNMGAFAIFIDPNGAALGLFQSTVRAGAKAPAAKPAAAKKPAAKKPAAKAKKKK